jgi:hypothetical protein
LVRIEKNLNPRAGDLLGTVIGQARHLSIAIVTFAPEIVMILTITFVVPTAGSSNFLFKDMASILNTN